MGEREAPPTGGGRLGGLDWSRGLTKAALMERLPPDDPVTRLVARHLDEGPYFSPRDVLGALPPAARAEAEALPPIDDRGRAGDASGSAPAGDRADASGRPADASPPAGGAWSESPADPPAPTGDDPGAPAAPPQRAVGRVSEGTAAVATAASRARGWVATAQGAAGGAPLPDRFRQTAAQARDQVLSIRTRASDAPPLPPESREPAPRSAWATLSATLDRWDRAVSGRPGSAMSFGTLGLTLGLLVGLGPLLRRRGRRGSAGADLARVRPWFLAAGGAAVAANLWGVWRAASATGETTVDAPGWSGLDPAGPSPSATSASAVTDEYPTVGSI